MNAIEITKDGLVVDLAQNELAVLCNALNEAMKGLEAWEFPIRTGFEVKEADDLLKILSLCYEKTQINT